MNETGYISFIKYTTGFLETRNTNQHIYYLSFSWSKVSRKRFVVVENTSVMSKTSYSDCIAFIHWQYHSSWTTFKSCMSWGNFQNKMTGFLLFRQLSDSYSWPLRSNWKHKVLFWVPQSVRIICCNLSRSL